MEKLKEQLDDAIEDLFVASLALPILEDDLEQDSKHLDIPKIRIRAAIEQIRLATQKLTNVYE